MNTRQIQHSKEIYGIEEWGQGYYSIDKQGQVVATPLGENGPKIPFPELIAKAKDQGINTPMIVRFPQIIQAQIEALHEAFQQAIVEFDYPANHRGVFPFKVNQRREFIDNVAFWGNSRNWGLEVGSKSEFIAALSYPLAQEALFICNGFKDRQFIEMAFTASSLGKNIIVVAEGPEELQMYIEHKAKQPKHMPCPDLGLRIRLYSKGSGKWQKSSGEGSKFGLTTIELMHCLQLISEAGIEQELSMLHFHIGSQITAIKRFKNALREAARVYAKIHKSGFSPLLLNIGGGVGVDYDGSHSSGQSSANYSLQEFANDAVYVIGEVCKQEDVRPPHIVTESGRVIAAYHSVVVTDIREVQGGESLANISPPPGQELHQSIHELEYIHSNISSKNYVEYYHDALEFHEDLFTLFNLGYISLTERAIAEELLHKICRKTLYFASPTQRDHGEFQELQRLKVSKYLANFSIFQSIPDAWSIAQLFPVMPLSRHDEKPTLQATIVDITCDSDGCLDRFVDPLLEKNALDLHPPNGHPYYLGFFLVGAYQESLSNEHNLFGAIHEVEVLAEGDSWKIVKTTPGDQIKELLTSRNYQLEEMERSFRQQISQALEREFLKKDEQGDALRRILSYLEAYPYLQQ